MCGRCRRLSAWRIGQLAAERLVESYWQEAGEWPRAIALSAWGTANMRTGGDDVAQALALDRRARRCGRRPPGRVTGFAITPLGELKRPRVDVTFRVSGLFRDALSDPDGHHRQRGQRHRHARRTG